MLIFRLSYRKLDVVVNAYDLDREWADNSAAIVAFEDCVGCLCQIERVSNTSHVEQYPVLESLDIGTMDIHIAHDIRLKGLSGELGIRENLQVILE